MGALLRGTVFLLAGKPSGRTTLTVIDRILHTRLPKTHPAPLAACRGLEPRFWGVGVYAPRNPVEKQNGGRSDDPLLFERRWKHGRKAGLQRRTIQFKELSDLS
jgi:hypothetical protein